MEIEYAALHPNDPELEEVMHTVRRRGIPAQQRSGWQAPRGHSEDPGDPIAWEEFAQALSHAIGLPIEEAERDAAFVMDIFGFDDRVIDNVLERPDRQFFYILEEEGMLTTDREETTIWDGREWRTHYWQLRKAAIRKIAEEGQRIKHRRDIDPAEAVYAQLPPDAWTTTSRI